MRQHRTLGRLAFSFCGLTMVGPLPPASAQNTPTSAVRGKLGDPARVELATLQALRSNPVTAPYLISAAMRDGKLVLSGKVGTHQIHDIVVRTVIETGYPIRDDLTIDTAEAHRVAASPPPATGPAGSAGLRTAPSLGASPSGLPYVYPPPLFGRLDDPFFGFEPPLVSYAPWYRAVTARAPINLSALAGAGPLAGTFPIPLGSSPADGSIELTLDQRGQAVLRGVVPTLADRVAIGQKVAQVPGVTQVLNLLGVGVGAGPGVGAVPVDMDRPPPPPQPAAGPALKTPPPPRPAPPPEVAEGAPRGPIPVDGDDLTQLAIQAIQRRPGLDNLPLKVSTSDGIATISGQVPSVYEAMLAFRAVQQTPGVREVIDRLEFVVPDGERKNPLIDKGRPEDVEPYLVAQVRRQAGALAHIDQVRLRGNTVEVRGSLAREADRPRFEAILRSMPVLRGFRVEPVFNAD